MSTRHYPLRCTCVHYDALTCIAWQNNTTRFNASIVFATSTKEERNGKCQCPCHKDGQGQPISEEVWNRAHDLQSRAKPARKHQNNRAAFVAPVRDGRGRWQRQSAKAESEQGA